MQNKSIVKKSNLNYICHACGDTFSKWSGKCGSCGEWGGLEEISEKTERQIESASLGRVLTTENINADFAANERINIHNMPELDQLLGGGLVKGSVVLIGGEPGIGKSTLLLQLAHLISQKKFNCVYVSGEESPMQIKMRATRLNMQDCAMQLLATTSLESICATILSIKNIDLLIIDSIQTIFSEKINSNMGSIAQVKLCTHELVTMAKNNNIIIILVGHITKDGAIAGPKFLEHMVDVVLYFEGDQNYRILRSVKNRYGASNEIAVFEMIEEGLKEVTNLSLFFLSNYNKNISGSVIFAGMEGSRPLLTEIQALISPSYMPMPRRATVGWDLNRLSIILAVLAARCNIIMGDKEIYLNVVGGLKLQDPSGDLAVACALISVFYNKVLPENSIIFGEIGLAGEVRKVQYADRRIKEAQKLGFKVIIMPDQEIIDKNFKDIKIIKVKYLNDLIKLMRS